MHSHDQPTAWSQMNRIITPLRSISNLEIPPPSTGDVIEPPRTENAPSHIAPAHAEAYYCLHLCPGLPSCQYPHRGYRPLPHSHRLGKCHHLASWQYDRRTQNVRASSNLPPPYIGATFSHFLRHYPPNIHRTHAVRVAASLQSLYICGAPLSGKTSLAAIIGSEHLKRGRQVEYTTAPELMLQLRYNAPSCEERLNHCQTVPVLILDDLGTERLNEYCLEQLYMVLKGRHRANLRTILTSEYPPAQTAARYIQTGLPLGNKLSAALRSYPSVRLP